MGYSIVLSIVIALLFWGTLRFFCGGWSPNKIVRGIDSILSKSQLRQVFFLISCVFFVFIFLVSVSSIGSPIDNRGFWFKFLSSLSHFFNPGSFYKSDGIHNGWVVLFNLFGMVLMTGLLISVLSNLLERRVDKLKAGRIYYKFKNHIVIIGYDKMTASLIKQIAKKYSVNDNGIVLQTTQDIPTVRRELFSGLNRNLEERIYIVSGNRNSKEDLEKLCFENCCEVFILGENNEYDHDSVNIECLKKMAEIYREGENGQSIRCHVQFEYQSTYAVFQQQDVLSVNDKVDFVPFNFYESWAQKVFLNNAAYPNLDREGITPESEKYVHLVVLGMSRMGIAMGVQAAHLCHFPNFVTKGLKTRITFIDENAYREFNFLRTRYPHLFEEIDWYYQDMQTGEMLNNTKSKKKFTDIEFEFIQGRIETPDIQNLISRLAESESKLLTIAVCFNFSPVAIAAGLYLPDEIYTEHIPVFIRQETSSATIDLLSENYKYKNVKPFGMLDDAYDLNKSEDLLPKMIKYVYDQTGANDGKDIVFKKEDEKENTFFVSFEEPVLKENWTVWKDRQGVDSKNTIALKFSNIYNANTIKFKQRALHIKSGQALTNGQINLLARVEHNRWNIEKLLMGYRACTPEETEAIASGTYSKQHLRDKFIHNDIKAYEVLTEDDNGIQADLYDVNISKALPYILSAYEKLKENRENNE